MHDEVVPRVGAILLLALVGLGAGWAGASLGVGAPLTETGHQPSVVVSETGVTVSDGTQETTILDNMTAVESLRIQDQDGHLTVDTERAPRLTEAKRERALAIARENETVQHRLAAMDAYELTVEPIKGIPAEAMSQSTFEASYTNVTAVEESEGTFTVAFDENASIERSGDGVTITPGDQRYVENDVNVEIREPDSDDVVAEAQVNLPEERVVIVTDE
jgi:hypothetical protein